MPTFKKIIDKDKNKNRSNGPEPYFIPFDGENRCIKCCFYYREKLCRKAKCTPEERKDGLQGYFRDPAPPDARMYSSNVDFNIPY